ncbi:MAG: bifunctional folylpolyglutamate synthase/dihydrofolate synthase [Gemmatimonadales bacterium]
MLHSQVEEYRDTVEFLCGRTTGRIKWSLGPTRELLEVLGQPHTHFPSIHIGGSNGKGSVAAMVSSALRCAGYCVAIYSSPHLVDVRERSIVDGRPIPIEALIGWTNELRDAIVATGASFFEAITAIAFADFAARGADIAVVEVGLGGRLDSTNVIDPLVSAVTNIAVEHTDYLGDSATDIVKEKAGIAKPDKPFVVGEMDLGLAALLRSEAERLGAVVREVPRTERYGGKLELIGAHQARNAAVAKMVLSELPPGWRPGRRAVVQGLAKAWLPGRYDRRGKWLFDVAHNPSGMSALVAQLECDELPRPLGTLFGVLADKDWETMLDLLLPHVDDIYVTTPPSAPCQRRVELAAVKQRFPNVEVREDFDSALTAAQADAGTVLVTGSLHTVGDALARLPGFQPLG